MLDLICLLENFSGSLIHGAKLREESPNEVHNLFLCDEDLFNACKNCMSEEVDLLCAEILDQSVDKDFVLGGLIGELFVVDQMREGIKLLVNSILAEFNHVVRLVG